MQTSLFSLSIWPPVMQALALAVPTCFALGAGLAGRARPFRGAAYACAGAVLAALVFAAALVVAPAGALPGADPAPWALARVDGVTATMLVLVSGLGWVVVRYSRTYLGGDPGQARFARWLLATLSTVATLVIADHLLVMAAAWTLTSLALHQLLTYYRERPAALVAAHKKFLVSRLADLCLWAALVLIFRSTGTLRLGALASWVSAHGELPMSLHVAAVLCAIAAALKSAQLPFHGWLIQVMEAPTPVSALLHAGIVNLGGFLMIRLASVMAHAPAAQLLLVVIGMVTAVLAALIAATRVSVKVALAWSTCAQMGFMLVECGLGAWHLALLHLVAHSLYKAHAFLSAGSAVEAWQLQALAPRASSPSPLRMGGVTLAALAAMAAAVIAGVVLRGAPAVAPSTAVLALVVALSLAPMLASSGGGRVSLALRALFVAALYAAWHVSAAWLWPALASADGHAAGWAVVAVGFVALFVAQAIVAVRPRGDVARAVHTWLFAGLYLDERFTRLTFRVWPPRLPPPRPPRSRGAVRVRVADAAEVAS
ncbi:MAG TPA: NADH-quinone oxidoreductase subunit L [Kofleriaceae bacterium]|nr:NADH-quinone oxidoreductase subunit L [Kofleriaceae bacterium]